MFAPYPTSYSGVPACHSCYSAGPYALEIAEARAQAHERERRRRVAEARHREKLRDALWDDYLSLILIPQRSVYGPYDHNDRESCGPPERFSSKSMRHDETKPQLHMKRSSRPWPAANHGKPQPQKSEPVRIPIDPSLSQERSQAIAVNSPAVETQSPESHATSFESVLSSLADPMPSDPKPMKPEVEAAARKIQFTWRSRAARRTALSRIAALRSQYDSIRDSFALPEHPDFARSPSGSPSPSPRSSISHPPLLYTKTNAPILAHEEALTRLLTKLDAVESNGDHKVRNARRALAKDVEKHSNDLELQMSLKWDELSRSESENECAVDDSEMDAENDHEAQVLAPEGGFEPLAAPAEGPNSTVSENGTVPAPQGEITKHSSSLPSKLDDSPAAHSEDSMVESDISLARDSTVSSDSDSDSDRQDEWDEMVVELGINPEEDWVDVQTE